MQDAIENCHYPELVGEPLRLLLNFTFRLEYVTELIVMGERISSVAVDKFDVVEKLISKFDNVSPANNQSYFTTQVSVPWFFSL